MKKQRIVFIGLLLMLACVSTYASDRFAFNIGSDVYTADLNKAGAGTTVVGNTTVTINLSAQSRFTLFLAEPHKELTGTYKEVTLHGNKFKSYAVTEWEDKAQNKALIRLGSELVWLSQNVNFLVVNGAVKLYVTPDAEANIKKFGMKLDTQSLTLTLADGHTMFLKDQGKTVIVSFNKKDNSLRLRYINYPEDEVQIAVHKDGEMEVVVQG